MPMPATLDVCRRDLFTARNELEAKYDAITVARVLRLRDMYTWKIGYPDSTDREFVDEVMSHYGISQSAAYSDLNIIKQLIPLLSSASRDFHRWRTNEMLLETFAMAKRRKDTRTMGKVARDYGKLNRVDLEDEQVMPYDDIVYQPFTATDDPTVLGIKPIPNIQEKIRTMIAKYRAESIDIEDIEAEEIDLEEEELFGEASNEETD